MTVCRYGAATGRAGARAAVPVHCPPRPPRLTYRALHMRCGRRQDLALAGDLAQMLARWRAVWIDVCTPDAADMQFLQSVLGVHPLVCDDIMERLVREKLDLSDGYVFASVCAPDTGDSVAAIVFEPLIVTLHAQHEPVLNDVVERLQQLTLQQSFGVASAASVLYILLDAIADRFSTMLDRENVEVAAAKQLALRLSPRDMGEMMHRMSLARKRMTDLFFLLNPKVAILTSLLSHQHHVVVRHIAQHLRGLIDRYDSLHRIGHVRRVSWPAGAADRWSWRWLIAARGAAGRPADRTPTSRSATRNLPTYHTWASR